MPLDGRRPSMEDEGDLLETLRHRDIETGIFFGPNIFFKPNFFLDQKLFSNQLFFSQQFFSDHIFFLDLLRQPQDDQIKPNILNQICQTKPIKPNLPTQTF